MVFVIPTQVRNTFSSRNNKCRDASGMRPKPECIVLGVADCLIPSGKPPVRIFLGTEPAHYRAERVFLWSIEQVRDPTRVYEIYLMKELAGFNRRRWLTGFTNYRFAIPHFAGGKGRAIWNDVDQAYLADPAELFDLEMGECGVLTVPPLSSSALLDTAVMLIDCDRMSTVWTLNEAQHGRKNKLLANVVAKPGLRGHLPAEWHAREEEYVPGRSKLLHWTVLHTQPWRPLPQLFVYQHNPVGQVWHDMERQADAAGYQVFTVQRPSAQYANLLKRIYRCQRRKKTTWKERRPSRPVQEPDGLCNWLRQNRPATILDCRFTDGAEMLPPLDQPIDGQARPTVLRYDATDAAGKCPGSRFDAVVCADALNYLPDEDVPWAIEWLFDRARQCVYAGIENDPQFKVLPDGSRLQSRPRNEAWWQAWFDATARRYPNTKWKLVFNGQSASDDKSRAVHEIGWDGDTTPRIWVLADDDRGDTSQALALADALGWPYEVKSPPFDTTGECPDLVIAANRRSGRWARKLSRKNNGQTRCVRIDGSGDAVAGDFDLVLSPSYFHLPPHPQRVETATRLSRITTQRLAWAKEQWPHLFGQAPKPHIVLLLSDCDTHTALRSNIGQQMGEEIRTFAQLAGGSVLALISRRIKPGFAGALAAGLGESRHIHSWSPELHDDETYLAYLEMADALIVTGNDQSLLADAAASGKPVYIHPLAEQRATVTDTLRASVFARSQARPLNKRGTVRPQQSLEYLCARLVERGIVHPPQDLATLQQTLIRLGIAHAFGSPLVTSSHAGLQVAAHAARQVRQRLRLGEQEPSMPYETNPDAAIAWQQTVENPQAPPPP